MHKKRVETLGVCEAGDGSQFRCVVWSPMGQLSPTE